MLNILNVNMLNIFIPSFIILILIAIAVAILILCNEDDVDSDKYHKARRVPTKKEEDEECHDETYHDYDYYCASEKCNSKTYKFLNCLYDNFPSDFVIIPNVKVGKLISAFDNPTNFDKCVLNKTMDVGIFLKDNMQPLCMIDLVDPNSNEKNMQKADALVLAAISKLKIPVAEVVANDFYDDVKLKQELLKLMPANIKKKYA